MARIKYVGTSDFRELAAEDLAKAGVEGFRKTSFARGEYVEVSEEVATALIEETDLFDEDFEEETPEEAAKREASEAEKAKSKKAAKSDGESNQESTGSKSVTTGSGSTALTSK